MIVGQNSLLNQYVPTIYIKDLLDGQTLRYDSTRRAFVNANASGGSGADRLGELLDVADSVDNPLSLQNGQVLTYNSFTSLWENEYIGGSAGTAGQVLTSNGLGNTPTWQTIAGSGSVTTVSVVTANGVSGVVANPTTTPAITLTLGAITPTSVVATGSISGSNLSGINTGNQVITLTGDATNSNTSTGGVLTLTTVNPNVGTFGSATQVPVFTVDGKGRITGVTNTTITGGGTVTSVAATGSADITVGGSPITTSGTLTFSLSNTTVVPNTYGSATQVPVFTVDSKGRITGVTNTTISAGSGTVTSVSGSGGTTGLTLTGGPITTSGTLTLGGTLAIANGGTGATTAAGARTGLGATTVGSNLFTLTNPSAITFLRVNADNTVTALSASAFRTAIGAGTGDGTVTSVAATGSSDITVGGSPITTSGTLTFALSNTTVTPATYGSATQVPVFAVDAKGRITSVTNTAITGGSNAPEIVTFQYSPGVSGTFTGVTPDTTGAPNTTVTITSPGTCVATYEFTGKSNPPKSITLYGQVFSSNTFIIKDSSSLPTANVVGGGTNLLPDIANGIFNTGNVLTLQTRPADTGAVGAVGQRAWLVVVFGF